MKTSDDIVITGMGVVSAIGCDEGTFWESLCTGRSGAGPVEGLDTTDLPRKTACQIRDPINAEEGLGRASRLAITAAVQAVDSAALTRDDLASLGGKVIVGTTMGETQFIESRLTQPDESWLNTQHAREIHAGRPGSIAGHVRRHLHLDGSSLDLYGACAAGNMAIALARRALLDRECEVVLAGGADGFSRLAFLGFMRSRVMAADVCRPFDQKRDGLLVGEGAGMFVLERWSSAEARGAPVRAVVSGVGLACESYHPTRPHPEGDGLARAIAAVLNDSGLSPDEMDYINAHGTGTPHNDAIENKVMGRFFSENTPFSSIKALTGHPMGAASALESACCVLSLEHQTLIPTWNLEQPLQSCGLEALRGGPRAARLRRVLNISAGFGGYNAAVVLSQP